MFPCKSRIAGFAEILMCKEEMDGGASFKTRPGVRPDLSGRKIFQRRLALVASNFEVWQEAVLLCPSAAAGYRVGLFSVEE